MNNRRKPAIEKSIKLNEIENLTAALVRFRTDRCMVRHHFEFEDFGYWYNMIFDDTVAESRSHFRLDILNNHQIEKMDRILAYLYSELEFYRKHNPEGVRYDGPSTDAIDSAIIEYQASPEFQKEVEDYQEEVEFYLELMSLDVRRTETQIEIHWPSGEIQVIELSKCRI